MAPGEEQPKRQLRDLQRRSPTGDTVRLKTLTLPRDGAN
jgi:hypothetical protein